jgi:hypothetical protein
MSKPIFSELEKAYLARFLNGEMPHATTPFEARAFLERAAAATDPNDHDERLVSSTFLLWADDIDPPPVMASRSVN